MGPASSVPAVNNFASPSPPRRIVGYYAGWTSRIKNFVPADIPAEQLTHVNYAFGLIGENGRAILGDAVEDIERPYPGDDRDRDTLKGNFNQLRLLKERHPHLQTFISMGGWTGSGRFSDAVATARKRHDFVTSCIELFLTRWPGVFDGIDIDWEYPVGHGLPDNSARPEDRRNCTLLFAELRRQLDDLGSATGRHYPLTAAIPAGRFLPVTCFELRESAQFLDWINIMTYDMNGSEKSGLTNFNAPFRASSDDPRRADVRQEWSVIGSVEAFEEEGVPRDQIVVGVPFYGRGFTGVSAVNNGLYQPFSSTMGADYHTILSDYLPRMERFRDPQTEAPWLYDTQRGTLLGYDDPESIARKTDFVVDEGLGGIMIWELSGDDAQRSLLTAISSRLRPR